jgi:tetratricopeptide (TPR) repeat protein
LYFPLLFSVLLLFAGALFTPMPAAAQPASFYQKGLSPVAMRLLFRLQELSNKGEYAKGLQKFNEFNKSRRSDQDLPPLLGFVVGNLHFQLGNYQAAVTHYRRVVAQAPEFYTAYENYGMALLQAEDYPPAGRTVLKAAAMIPKNVRPLKYRAAIGFFYGGELEKARTLLVELTSPVSSTTVPVSASDHPPADWLKALLQVDWQLEDYKAAVVVAEKLVDSYPDKIDFWRLYGQVALAAAEYRKALSAYKVMQSEGHITLPERRQIAGICQRLELYQDAAEILEEIFAEVKPEPMELKQLVAVYRRTGAVEKALSTLDRLQKLYPDSANLFQRGEILYSAGRYREAARVFLTLKKIPENDGRQYILAGYCAWNIDDFPAAASAWQKAATYPARQKQALDLLQTLKPWLATDS